MKKIVVAGLGSMGQRRIRLLKSIEDFLIFGVDSSKEARDQSHAEFNIETFKTFDEAFSVDDYDIGFVCTSPESHFEIIKLFLTHKLHVFSELNLLNESHKTLIELSEKVNRTLFLSSTFLYRKEIQYIRSLINSSLNPYIYNYHVGQFLLDWHPWQATEDYFIFKKKTNALREIMAIEIPWIIEVFGNFKIKHVESNKISDLKIDFDDTIHIHLEHESGHEGYLLFDVISPKPVRQLKIYNQMSLIEWQGTVDSLKIFDKKTNESKFIELYDNVDHHNLYANYVVENAYKEEIIQFLMGITKKVVPEYSFDKDIETLKIIDKIEDQSNEI